MPGCGSAMHSSTLQVENISRKLLILVCPEYPELAVLCPFALRSGGVVISFTLVNVFPRLHTQRQVRTHASSRRHERPQGDRFVLIHGIRKHGTIRRTEVDETTVWHADHSISGQAV